MSQIVCGKFNYYLAVIHKKITKIFEWVPGNVIFIAWIFAGLSLLGSIALSEVWGLEPCRLCWYQRYILLTAIILLGIAEFKKLQHLYKIILPVTLIGWAIAFYHSLLQWGIVKESLTCAIDAPCALASINWFGFITIPFMSLMVFTVLVGLMVFQHLQRRRKG